MENSEARRRRKVSYDFFKKSERSKRISIDIDKDHLKVEPLKVLRVYFAMKQIFPNVEISVEKTLKGFHVKAVGIPIKRISVAKRIQIREILGDDPERIKYDQFKLKHGLIHLTETLFEAKIQPGGQFTIAQTINPIASPSVSKVPAKKP